MNQMRPLNLSQWLPTPGNMLFTLLVTMTLFYVVQQEPVQGALETSQTSTTTISYQGQLTNASGTPLTGDYDITFRLYNAANGSSALWTEQWTGVNNITVTDGLFQVMLGSLTAIPQVIFTANPNLWIGVKVGADNEMTPRIQLGSTPFAVQALTVPDLAIQTSHIADGAVTGPKLSRQIYEVIAPADIPMPNGQTTYDILSQIINPSQPALITIHASIGLENSNYDTFYGATLLLDGNAISVADTYNKGGYGEQTMMSTSVFVNPGQHVIKIQAYSWLPEGKAVGAGRTRLVIVEE